MNDERSILKEWVEKAKRIVFFGGAGVSTESGLPDFRSTDGLYYQQYDYPPEQILSHTFFLKKPEEFYRFYWEKMIYPEAKPNKAHMALAKWEKEKKLTAVITQNIDGLHQAAGSKAVYELHGSVLRNHCMKCGKFYRLDQLERGTVPHCTVDGCGGLIKPDVVLYEESLDENVLVGSIQQISMADMLIVGGTSLNVYPAAGLLRYFQGRRLVLINKDATPRDKDADLVIHDKIGEVFGEFL